MGSGGGNNSKVCFLSVGLIGKVWVLVAYLAAGLVTVVITIIISKV